MPTLTSTGLTIRSQAEILASLEAAERAEISPELDLSTSSPLGQLNRLLARALRMSEEGLQAVYAAIDPDSASGDALRRLSALTGTYQEAATKTRVVASLDLDAGTYAIGALVCAPAGRAADRFANVESVTSLGGATSVILDAETAGPIAVTANVLEIASPLAGFNSVVSNLAGTLGQAIETEAALRARRRSEVESPGSSSAAGIVADITRNIPGVISASVTENDTDGTVDSIPAHSFEAIVFGPETPTADDNDLVASQILASKAAGIGTYGNTSRTVQDSEGVSHVILFTRPVEVPILPVTLTLSVNASTYAGDAAVRAKIVERAAEVFVPGLNASWSQVLAWAHEVQGVLRATTINLGSGAFTDVSINSRQIATLADSDITVTSVSATP